MGRLSPITAVALLLALTLASCGGGGQSAKAPTKTTKTSPGGIVGAEGTAGLIGPSATVDNGKQEVTGKTQPMSPDAAEPGGGTNGNGVAGAAACASSSASPSNANLRAMASAVICLLNSERAKQGLTPLKGNARLTKASQLMANLMVKRRFFAHDTPDGRSVVDRVKPTGYISGSWSLGENLAWGSGGFSTPTATVSSWMHSKGHRENILRGKFKDVGIGIRLGAPGQGLSGGATYVADFGRHG